MCTFVVVTLLGILLSGSMQVNAQRSALQHSIDTAIAHDDIAMAEELSQKAEALTNSVVTIFAYSNVNAALAWAAFVGAAMASVMGVAQKILSVKVDMTKGKEM